MTGVIALGTAQLAAPLDRGGDIPFGTLGANEYVGLTALTREKLFTTIVAVTDVTIVAVSVDVLEELVRKRPALARDIGRTIDNRRAMADEAGPGGRGARRDRQRSITARGSCCSAGIRTPAPLLLAGTSPLWRVAEQAASPASYLKSASVSESSVAIFFTSPSSGELT
jgi:hypothetical protein